MSEPRGQPVGVVGDAGVGRRRRPAWVAWAGFVLGLVMLAAAIWVVLGRDPAVLGELVDRISGAPWWAGVCIVLGPILNWLLVSSCLWSLLRRHGRVGWGEMNALVGSAWLLNHLPMRPGLIGRVGYHKLVNGIRVRDAIESTVWSLVLAAVSGLMALALAGLLPEGHSPAQVGLVILGPVCVSLALSAGARAMGRPSWGWLLAGLALRYADLGVWAGRYAVVFWVLGLDVSVFEIIVITGVSQVAQLVPIAGGGMGLREWLVAVTAGWFAGGASSSGLDSAFDAALAGDLINRAAETLVVVPVGLACAWIVARRVARARSVPSGPGGPGPVGDAAEGVSA